MIRLSRMTIPLCLLLIAAALPSGDVRSPPAGIAETDTVPDLQVTTLEGEVVGLRDLLGERVTIINLWATWCLPCRDEIPDLNAWAPGLPFTLLVDSDGVVRRSMYGQQTTERLEQALSAVRVDEP